MGVDLSLLKRQIVEQASERVRRACEQMTDDLKREAPVDTGELRRTTGAEVTRVTDRQVTAEARIDTDYAEYVTQGTRPHLIVPRKPGGVLVFEVNGTTVFTKRVNHPGTQANPFFDNIVSRWNQYLRSQYAR